MLFRITFLCAWKASLSGSCLLAFWARNEALERTKWCLPCFFLLGRLLLSCAEELSRSDLWPRQETAPSLMSQRTASIYQASAASFDLQQHVTWSYLNKVHFSFVAATRGVCEFTCCACLLPFGVLSLVQRWVEKFDLQFLLSNHRDHLIV